MTRLLIGMILVGISSWPVWGLAGDIGATPLTRWALIGDDKGNRLLECDEHYRNCTGPVITENACYQRMREAMRVIDAHFNGRKPTGRMYGENELIDILTHYESTVWQNAMKDCVEGKP